jgi:hypothetical protein
VLRIDRRRALPTIAVPLVLAVTLAACRSRSADETPRGAGQDTIQAVVTPSADDAHLALLPQPVQLAVQVRPPLLFADPTLALAATAFLAAVSDDAAATKTCLERLARDGDVVTYAWIGGAADGWVLLADATLEPTTLATCMLSFGIVPPPGGVADPTVGNAVRLGADGAVLLARLGPRRRALGLAATVEAVRARAAVPGGGTVPTGGPDDLLPRLRQGELKLYADLDQLAALGAPGLPLIDDADRVGLLLRLETMRADAVLLAHARSGPAIARLEETLGGTLAALRRAILDEPGVSEAAVYRVFDDARVERIEQVLRIQLLMDRPTLSSLVGFLAYRAMPLFRGVGNPQPPAIPAPPPTPAPTPSAPTAPPPPSP